MSLELLAAVLVFVSVSALVAAILARPAGARAVERRLSGMLAGGADEPQVQGDEVLRRGHHSAVPALRRVLERSEWSQRTWTDLQQAGLPLKVGEYLLLRILVAVFAVLIVLFLTGGGFWGLLASIAAGAVASFLPVLYVKMKKSRRQRAIGNQMVETLQLISNALRSGFAFTQAVEMASKQLSPPIQDELDRFIRDTNLGARLDDALRGMVDRTGSVDMEMLVTTIMVQRLTGGNLSEVLENVSETIRERQRLQAEIQALTAQQRLTGFILSIYPLALGLLFLAIAPSIWSIMLKETIGLIVLGFALCWQTLGALWIRQILKLEV